MLYFDIIFVISERNKSYCLIVFILQHVFKVNFIIFDTIHLNFNNSSMTLTLSDNTRMRLS